MKFLCKRLLLLVLFAMLAVGATLPVSNHQIVLEKHRNKYVSPEQTNALLTLPANKRQALLQKRTDDQIIIGRPISLQQEAARTKRILAKKAAKKAAAT